MNKKETVGKASYDLALKNHTPEHVIDYGQEMRKDYIDNLIECAQSGRKTYHGDFFIVVLNKRERLMDNTFRNFFLHRKSCPTPTHDQTVFKYDASKEEIEFIWVVPDMETCVIFLQNADNIDPEERGLLKFVLDFTHGKLDALARFLNNEEYDGRESTRTIISAS